MDEHQDTNEETRLTYRYIDLRRPEIKDKLLIRNKLTQILRNFLNKHDFIDIETPILTKSTPEGARDYIVPSRVHEGCFLCLTSITTNIQAIAIDGSWIRKILSNSHVVFVMKIYELIVNQNSLNWI